MFQLPDRDRPSVVLTGASPEPFNRNAALLRDVAEGFGSLLGTETVCVTHAEFATRRVLDRAPQLVVTFGSCLPDCCDFSHLRKACDVVGCPLVFWLHDDPYEFDARVKVLPYADHIFTNDRAAALQYPRASAWHLPLAASPRRHWIDIATHRPSYDVDVFFCGTGYPNRQQMLCDLRPVLETVRTRVCGSYWDTKAISFCHNDRIDNSDLPRHYASSRTVLNMGRIYDLSNRHRLAASTPGPRTFEAAMSGACQLYFADSLEVLDYFDADREIILFDDVKSFRQQLTSLIEDDARRTAIAAAAQTRALRDHTYAARVNSLLDRVGLNVPQVDHPSATSLAKRSVA
jgi:spore maturation protein CgeB